VPSARHYRTEPYALPADVYRWGRGGWTWYTGSAAWLYDVYLRDFLGFDKRGNEVTLKPHLPQGWEECTVLYHFGSSRYQLTSGRDTLFVTLDGVRVQGEYITLRDDGRTHEARFPAAR
jgi:cellobiose phosphorylase